MQNEQVVAAFEILGLTPDQIAEQLHFELTAIKACLMQFSSKYRAISKQDQSFDFTQNELQEANETIVRLMRSAEDEHLQARLARYIRDDKKGRLDIGRNLGGIQMNIIQFNSILQEAKKALQKDKSIDVPNLLQESSA